MKPAPPVTNTSMATTLPIRVLWLSKGLGPGGAEQLILTQARRRDRARFDCRAAYVVPAKNHLAPPLEQEGVPVTCLGSPKPLIGWVWRLYRMLVRQRPQVVHVHSPVPAIAARLLVRLMRPSRRPRLVYTEHNRWPRHRRSTRTANALTFGLNDTALAVSAEVRDSMPARLRPRVEVLRHGVDVAEVRSHASSRERCRAELGIAVDEVVVGTVANLRPEKDLGLMLEAAATVTTSNPAVRYVLVGQGPLEADLRERHAHLGLGERVLLAGYRPDALDVMSAFDVFTLSSLHEGLPVALMEALALGLPVVATRAGGIPELVSDGSEGLLVAPGDAEALAAAQAKVATDSELRARLAAAARSAGDRLDIGPAVRRLEELYSSQQPAA